MANKNRRNFWILKRRIHSVAVKIRVDCYICFCSTSGREGEWVNVIKKAILVNDTLKQTAGFIKLMNVIEALNENQNKHTLSKQWTFKPEKQTIKRAKRKKKKRNKETELNSRVLYENGSIIFHVVHFVCFICDSRFASYVPVAKAQNTHLHVSIHTLDSIHFLPQLRFYFFWISSYSARERERMKNFRYVNRVCACVLCTAKRYFHFLLSAEYI